MKKILLTAIICGAVTAVQAQSPIYSSPIDPPANNNGGVGAYNPPVDAEAAPNYYYFYDDAGTIGPDNYIIWSAAVVPGQLYRVSISWAADPIHNNNATFRMDYNGLSGWDSVSGHDQTLMADGSAPPEAPNWSGWRDLGVFRAGGSAFAFAWDFSNNPDTALPNTTGTVRLTPLDDSEFFPLHVSPLTQPNSSAWGVAPYNPAPDDANAAQYYYYFADGFIAWSSAPYLANGTQYEVDISWAAHPAHNSLASFRLDIDETNAVDGNFWDYIYTIDQTKLADGSTPATDGQWSGWKNLGTFTATHLASTFAWDFTAGSTGPNTTGTIRIRQVNTTEEIPVLSIAKLGSDIVLSWPSPSTGYVLKENSDLSPGNWTEVTETITDNGTTKSVTIPSPADRNFYRLEK